MTSAIFSSLLNTTAAIYKATHTADTVGNDKRSWTLSSTVSARLDKSAYSGSVMAYAEQGLADLPTHKLFCEAAVDIDQGDRVVVSAQTYEVVEVFSPGGVSHHQEAYLKWLKSV